tara:strand:- start:190 stop:579 length:390 start_codon:yes stop_codon:yes gene_type:complete
LSLLEFKDWKKELIHFGSGKPLIQQQSYARKNQNKPHQLAEFAPKLIQYEFFHEHVNRQSNDPIKVHDASYKKQSHQKPTTAKTVGAMIDPHQKGPFQTGPSSFGQKLHGTLAMFKARLLPGSELVNSC